MKNYEKAVKLTEKYQNEKTMLRNCNGNNEASEIVKKILARKMFHVEQSVRQFCDGLIKNKLLHIAENLPATGYSMGDKKTASFGKFSQTCDNRSRYSGKYAGSETHGHVSLRLTKGEYLHTSVIGGLITYIYPGQKSKVKKCYWIEGRGNKGNMELERVHGFIYAGYHSTDKKQAFEGGKRVLSVEKMKANKEKLMAKAMRCQYSFADSLAAGNCEAGTRAFVLRLGLDGSKKYRGKFLLQLAENKSTSSVLYVKRMIEWKARSL
jgi:hypothetical protein